MLRRLVDDTFGKKVEDNTMKKLEDIASMHLACINH
jgi:hypothetical protein